MSLNANIASASHMPKNQQLLAVQFDKLSFPHLKIGQEERSLKWRPGRSFMGASQCTHMIFCFNVFSILLHSSTLISRYVCFFIPSQPRPRPWAFALQACARVHLGKLLEAIFVVTQALSSDGVWMQAKRFKSRTDSSQKDTLKPTTGHDLHLSVHEGFKQEAHDWRTGHAIVEESGSTCWKLSYWNSDPFTRFEKRSVPWCSDMYQLALTRLFCSATC